MPPTIADTLLIAEGRLKDLRQSISDTHDRVALTRELLDDSRAVLRRADAMIAAGLGLTTSWP